MTKETDKPIDTYELSKDGEAITCLRCKRTSNHPGDVKNHYCGYCDIFHDLVWPASRKAFIAGSMALLKD